MDKPSDYGSDIRGSNPLGGTNLPELNSLEFTSENLYVNKHCQKNYYILLSFPACLLLCLTL